MKKQLSSLLWALPFSLYLAACGSGSNNDVAGIDGSGAPVASSTGTIDGFGSVIVNDVRYDSSKSTILINGQIGSEDDLHIGYRVTVVGTQDNDSGIAETIEFRPDLVGTITEINLALGQLVVLGQTVKTTNATIFDQAIIPNSLEGLNINDQILISGQTDSNGVITATRIERTTLIHQINGAIHDLNESNHTFSIRGITVNYSSANFDDIDNNQLSNNMRVSVRGSMNNSNIFVAQRIKGISDNFEKNIKKAEAEGFITRFTSTTDFEVDGIQCTTTPATEYEGGDQATLALGVSVEIKGTINTDGWIVAQKIEFDQDDNNHIQGQVTAITLNTSGSIITGTLQIGGASIQTNSSTRYEDKGDDQLRRFNLASIQTGDFLDVTGFNNNGVFIATKVERKGFNDNEDTEINIEGIVTSVGVHEFIVLGHTVVTTEDTTFEINDSTLTEEEFLLNAIGKQVKIEGILRDGIFTAIEVEIEDEPEESEEFPHD